MPNHSFACNTHKRFSGESTASHSGRNNSYYLSVLRFHYKFSHTINIVSYTTLPVYKFDRFFGFLGQKYFINTIHYKFIPCFKFTNQTFFIRINNMIPKRFFVLLRYIHISRQCLFYISLVEFTGIFTRIYAWMGCRYSSFIR